MSFIPHIIATAVFSIFIPTPTVSDVHIPDPDPLPTMAAQVVPQPIPEPEPEVKPIPSDAPTVSTEACNCYNKLKENFDSVPSMNQLLETAQHPQPNANVAVMKYPATPEWPGGIPHVALIREHLPDGSLVIEEYNYSRCKQTVRTIAPNYPQLVGTVSL